MGRGELVRGEAGKWEGEGAYGHGGADEESQDECWFKYVNGWKGNVIRMRTDDVMLMSPEIDVDGVENSQEREAPGDAIDDDLFSGGEELVDDCGEEEKVDKRPE